MINLWLLIFLLFIFTFISRIIGVEVMAGKELKPTLRLYFSYVPAAIITALIINQILSTANGQLTISYPILIGCLTTALSVKLTKMFLPSVILGMAIGLCVRYFL